MLLRIMIMMMRKIEVYEERYSSSSSETITD